MVFLKTNKKYVPFPILRIKITLRVINAVDRAVRFFFFFKTDALLRATKPSALARERHLVGK